jgi:hypothetical protein
MRRKTLKNKSTIFHLLLFFLTITGSVYGTDNYIQKDTGSVIDDTENPIYQDGSGNIGIQTTSPETKLHIINKTDLDPGEEYDGTVTMTLVNTASGVSSITQAMPGIEFVKANMDTTNKYGHVLKWMTNQYQTDKTLMAAIAPRATGTYSSSTNTPTAIDFFAHRKGLAYKTSPATLYMTINSDGKVGIRNTSPYYTLDVDGDFRVTDGQVFDLLVEEDSPSPRITFGHIDNSVCEDCEGSSIHGGGYSSYGNDIATNSNYSVIGGGKNNSISATGDYHVIIGGIDNDTSGANDGSSVLGGKDNLSSGEYSFALGGYKNTASGTNSIAAGGYSNNTSGNYSFAAGDDCTASGLESFVAGYHAIADDDNSFLWSDYSVRVYRNTPDDHTFNVHAKNDAWFSDDVTAESFNDASPYPEDIDTAYEALFSMQRLPDGEYDPNDQASQLDHSGLSDFVRSERHNGELGRNLSATISANNEVIKDLVARIIQIQQRIDAMRSLVAR